MSYLKDHLVWFTSVVSCDFWVLEHTPGFTSKVETGQTVLNVE